MNTNTPQNVLITFSVMTAVFLLSEPPLANALEFPIHTGLITYAALIHLSNKDDRHYIALFGVMNLVYGTLAHFDLLSGTTELYVISVLSQSPLTTTHAIIAGLLLFAAGSVLTLKTTDDSGWEYPAKAIGALGLFSMFVFYAPEQVTTNSTNPVLIAVLILLGTYLLGWSAHDHLTNNTPDTPSEPTS